MNDNVNHPSHYTAFHPEVIEVTQYQSFCIGNAIKYLARAGLKTVNPSEDFKKAEFYLKREFDTLSETTDPGYARWQIIKDLDEAATTWENEGRSEMDAMLARRIRCAISYVRNVL